MAITTKHSDVAIANYLVSKRDSAYIGIARSESWDDEINPPAPSELTTELDGLIGLKHVDEMSVCIRVRDGREVDYPTIQYNGQTWALLTEEEAYEENATHVYIEAQIDADDFPLGAYRQVGLLTGVETDETDGIVLPDQVTKEGLLEFYENRQPINRVEDMSITERFIIQVGKE